MNDFDSVKSCKLLSKYIMITVFTPISAAALIKFLAPRVRLLFEGAACLKTGRYKEIFSFNLTVYLPSVRKIYIYIISNRNVFSLSPSTSFGTFQWCLHTTQMSLSSSTTTLFWTKVIYSAVLAFPYSGFWVIQNSSNKRRIGTAALIRGRRFLTFLFRMRRLFQ